MAAGILPSPGSKYGPCDAKGSCEHLDCRATVREALSTCYHCGKSIGYETRFYRLRESPTPPGWPVSALKNTNGDPYILVHADCEEDAVERQR